MKNTSILSINKSIAECEWRALCSKWVILKKWRLKYKTAPDKRLGFASCTIRQHNSGTKYLTKRTVTLNEAWIQSLHQEQIIDTVRHEAAHAIDYEERYTSNHDEQWQKIAKMIGAEPTAKFYDHDGSQTPPFNYVAVQQNGKVVKQFYTLPSSGLFSKPRLQKFLHDDQHIHMYKIMKDGTKQRIY